MKPKISVVMPIHNDVEYLPYSLASLLDCPIQELILYLDRCPIETLKLIHAFNKLKLPYAKTIIVTKKNTWKHSIAGAFENGFRFARGDYIYTMASDMVTDPRIYNPGLFGVANADLISFRYKHSRLGSMGLHNGYMNFLNKLPFIYTCHFGKWSGHFAMKRKVWEQLHYRDVRSPDLDFFNRAYDMGFKHQFFGDYFNIHLRSGIATEKQIDQGLHRAETNVNPLKVLAHAFFELKPHVASSFLKARLNE